ncbi:MAG: hypothetical protein M1820_005327 [Bogoriella megaspora]|nr:MAG: hypothetical protein M1820_005327 [Bogoriella megaspora]
MAAITLNKRKIVVLIAGLVLVTLLFTTRYPSEFYDTTQTRLRPYLEKPSKTTGYGDPYTSSKDTPDAAPLVDTDRLDSDGINTVKTTPKTDNGRFNWAKVPQQYPVRKLVELPEPVANSIPRIQHAFDAETSSAKQIRLARLEAVKGNFTHAWEGYKKQAWLSDEVAPLSGNAQNPFGGWAATLVDSLDTLWMMGLYEDFEEAVEAIDKIDFTDCAIDEINVFETTIRYLGGFLAAYDISGGKFPQLLTKAQEIGEMLYVAFDTPNRMPVTRWNFKAAARGERQEAHQSMLVAELGSFSLEFTRLSQATGDHRFYDAIARITDLFESQQMKTHLPGLFSVGVNARDMNLMEGTGFTIGGMSDSTFEYLNKEHILLGGGSKQYKTIYERSFEAMKKHIFYRPMTPENRSMLFAGQVHSSGSRPVAKLKIDPEAQHLSCYAGGMVGIGAKLFGTREDLEIAKQLNEGCMWGYESFPLGIMPEIIHTVPCEDSSHCPWDEAKWKQSVYQKQGSTTAGDEKMQNGQIPKGVTNVDDARYILRPEAIESVWILYRLTGDPSLPDRAWSMFNSITKQTTTKIAHAGLSDCTQLGSNGKPIWQDRMESFWTAETLKYFYLMFADPELCSLDEFVLNTEAHPLRRPGGVAKETVKGTAEDKDSQESFGSLEKGKVDALGSPMRSESNGSPEKDKGMPIEPQGKEESIGSLEKGRLGAPAPPTKESIEGLYRT